MEPMFKLRKELASLKDEKTQLERSYDHYFNWWMVEEDRDRAQAIIREAADVCMHIENVKYTINYIKDQLKVLSRA